MKKRLVCKRSKGPRRDQLRDGKTQARSSIGGLPYQTKFGPLRGERKEVVAKEVAKLREVGFIRSVKYPKWCVNVVMVHKADEGWHMCINFTNLNTVCQKDNYLLPSVDNLVDKSSRAELLNFMDTHARYNQTQMSKEDEEKKTFVTNKGTFHYTRMSFGLRNTMETFQRLMNKVF